MPGNFPTTATGQGIARMERVFLRGFRSSAAGPGGGTAVLLFGGTRFPELVQFPLQANLTAPYNAIETAAGNRRNPEERIAKIRIL